MVFHDDIIAIIIIFMHKLSFVDTEKLNTSDYSIEQQYVSFFSQALLGECFPRLYAKIFHTLFLRQTKRLFILSTDEISSY